MKAKASKIDRLRELARKASVLHTRDLTPLGIPRRYLGRLCDEGLLMKTGRGLYETSRASESMHLALAQAAKAVPRGVICLLSALSLHEIGVEIPHQVWIALERRAARPIVVSPKIRVMRFSGKSFTEGIGEHEIAGVRVRIYEPAKTVADCFKYRNKIGLDVAIEALREALRERRCTVDSLWHYAKICRVSNVMRPYIEALA